jgi:hypothetical protein
MTTTAVHAQSNAPLRWLLRVAIAMLVVAILAGWNRVFGLSDRLAFLALVLVGLTLCSLSPLGKGALYGWWNPLHIFGYVMGAAALLLSLAVLLNLPLAAGLTLQSAVLVLAGVMLLKSLITLLYPHRG